MANTSSAMFVGVVAICLLLTANITIMFGMLPLPGGQWSLDVLTPLKYIFAAAACAALADARSLVNMFLDCNIVGKSPPKNVFISLFELFEHDRTIALMTIVINWLVGTGVLLSGFKLAVSTTATAAESCEASGVAPEVVSDLSGSLIDLNPLIRQYGGWPSVYGCACILYLTTFLLLSIAQRSCFEISKFALQGTACLLTYITMVFMVGLFAPGHSMAGAIMVVLPPCFVVLALLRAKLLPPDVPSQRPTPKRRPSIPLIDPVDDEPWYLIASKYRILKPISVFALALSLSLLHEHFLRTLYPVAMLLTYIYHIKSHPVNRGWNFILLLLTIAHQVIHHFTHSYYELDDQPLLWGDKLIHFSYAIIAAQQFREAKAVLSRDPLLTFFNYVNMFVWIPGGILTLYVAGFTGPSPSYHYYMGKVGGYCLSTGTAMAYCNRDFEEDCEPDSPRKEKVASKGISAHGVQIAFAFLFAVAYINSAGGLRWVADMLEYDWDYAAHLYTAYGAL